MVRKTFGNPRRDPRTGRFVGRFTSLRNLRRLAELTGEERDIDEAAVAILEAGIALAIQDGWIPPAGSNVQCAGGGKVAKDPAPFGLGPTHYERPTLGRPCGWKGERFASGYRPLTVKLCPRCGGRVEMIPQEAGS